AARGLLDDAAVLEIGGARQLDDDAAVIEVGGATLVLTHDMLAEGVHFLPDDPPQDVAWKLVAVNLSDIAAKGARPIGVLLGFPLGDESWDRAFVDGLGAALGAFSVPLLGGDTVKAPRVLGLTAIGQADGPVPARSGAGAEDRLWVTGSIGDAGAGLRMLKGEAAADSALVERYRKPRPRIDAGQALAPLVSAMMDVSDGLLLDASRMAGASGLRAEIELDRIPLSAAFVGAFGEEREARVAAATAGDDYELLFAAPASRDAELLDLSERLDLPFTRVGTMRSGSGLGLTHAGAALPVPARLGWEHG
ncbi:MAG TPA: thiamine-phosphate kinase, partial [Geminicoccaceae bacterium]